LKVDEGMRIVELVQSGLGFRAIADITGLSATTCWRRYWFFMDWTLPRVYGKPITTIPPLRGTRACPRGRPWIRAVDEGRWPEPESGSAPSRRRVSRSRSEPEPDLAGRHPAPGRAEHDGHLRPDDDAGDAELARLMKAITSAPNGSPGPAEPNVHARGTRPSPFA
jgi:hypothetical protein